MESVIVGAVAISTTAVCRKHAFQLYLTDKNAMDEQTTTSHNEWKPQGKWAEEIEGVKGRK